MRLTPRLRLVLITGLSCIAATAHAIDYRSVAETTVLYEKPAIESPKRYIVMQGTPVEVVREHDGWARVRSPQGALSWIQQEALSDTRTVMVTVTSALIRKAPEQDAVPVMEATRGVVLEMQGPAESGWIHVRHRDGSEGHVRINDVWGR